MSVPQKLNIQLVDDGTMDTVVNVNGQEFRYSIEVASPYRDAETGVLDFDSFCAEVVKEDYDNDCATQLEEELDERSIW